MCTSTHRPILPRCRWTSSIIGQSCVARLRRIRDPSGHDDPSDNANVVGHDQLRGPDSSTRRSNLRADSKVAKHACAAGPLSGCDQALSPSPLLSPQGPRVPAPSRSLYGATTAIPSALRHGMRAASGPCAHSLPDPGYGHPKARNQTAPSRFPQPDERHAGQQLSPA